MNKKLALLISGIILLNLLCIFEGKSTFIKFTLENKLLP